MLNYRPIFLKYMFIEVQFSFLKKHPFKVIIWWVLMNICSWKQHLIQDMEYCYHYKYNTPLYSAFSPLSHLSPWKSLIYSRCHINGIIQCVPFCVWFLSISTMLLRFISVVALYCYTGFYCMDLSQFVYSFICWWKFEFFPVLGNCEWRICV